ncbi:hypothetical protein RB195_008866 [Necator americanus]|uniref:Reverse transcriptase domain-containing protein n=1 Tax=Necator americanus TaxID=51031 RepID=A0ABR1CSH9_NECAM
MRRMEWDNMGVTVDGSQLHHLHVVDDIVLITSSINQGQRNLIKFDETCKKAGLQLNLDKAMFTRNGWALKQGNECSSNTYLGRKTNMMNDLTSELARMKQA